MCVHVVEYVTQKGFVKGSNIKETYIGLLSITITN